LVFNLGGLNGLFILFQVFVLSLYISLKNRKPTNIFQGFFGLGDLLFLLCAAFAFSVTYFIVFYILSLLFAIGITLLLKLSAKERLDKVPLAGYQALMLMAVLLYDQFSSSWHMISRVGDTYFGI
ncbi:hypothetical protein, partial [Pedobacter frigidisoli]|uniref:hypothetical protein n=1 Tax=Pedobacter frigidisoli TaxID=2530455 RepID=UPI00197CD6DB